MFSETVDEPMVFIRDERLRTERNSKEICIPSGLKRKNDLV